MEYLGALQLYRVLEILLKVNGEIVELIAQEILVNTNTYMATNTISFDITLNFSWLYFLINLQKRQQQPLNPQSQPLQQLLCQVST